MSSRAKSGIELVRQIMLMGERIYQEAVELDPLPVVGSNEASRLKDVSGSARLSELSSLSGLSGTAHELPESELDDLYEERAAIMEFDGDIERGLAEFLAYQRVYSHRQSR